MELEKEFKLRAFLHKVSIVKSAVANSYIKQELKRGGIMIPQPCLERNAVQYADEVLAKILFTGSLNETYDKVSEAVLGHMPDNYCINM